MIAYLDTSALVKLYVQEPGIDRVQRIVAQAAHVATSRVTYVEARAAFSRRHRERGLSNAAYREAVRLFEREWDAYARMEVTEPLIRLAGDYTEQHALRAYDAIQLASAVSLRRDTRSSMAFLAADRQLLAAAEKEGLRIEGIPV